MRVISGTARGRRLKDLPGLDTRPTTDKVKESMFNVLQFDIPGSRVLDLYGGSGQLTVEALSRGAAGAVILDRNLAAVKIIQENVQACGFGEQTKILSMDARAFLAGCKEKFDVIFLDPPYAGPLLEESLKTITEIDIVSEHGIIVCETMAQRELPQVSEPYQWGKDYRYGQIKLTICRRQGSDPRK